MKRLNVYFVGYLLCLLLQISCNKHDDGTPGTAGFKIVYPQNTIAIAEDSILKITIQPDDTNRLIARIDFLMDDTLIFSDNSLPYEYSWNTVKKLGTHKLEAIAYDHNDSILHKEQVSFSLVDQRLKYFGNYSFTIHKTSYGGINPPVDTTFNTDGTIRQYIPGDEVNSYYYWYSNNTYSNSKLTIEYQGTTNIITRVDVNGKLDSFYYYHPYQQGTFSDAGHITFDIGNGGLGGGYSFRITGVRK